jgi:archaellum component FlaF (FlaF/FlaG flagellin family)
MDKLTKYLLITLGIIIAVALVRMYAGIPFFSYYHRGDVKITTTCYGSDASSFRCPTTYNGYTVSECDVYSYTIAVLNPGEYCSYPQCKYSGGVCIEIWGYPPTTTTTTIKTTTTTTSSTTTTTLPSTTTTTIPMICNPGEKKNFRCDGNYKVWDECSSDGKSWSTNREYCNYGCFNGGCNQYAPTTTTLPPTTTTQPVVQPQPIQPTTTTLPPQEQPQPTINLIPIIIALSLIIIISVFLIMRRKKYG